MKDLFFWGGGWTLLTVKQMGNRSSCLKRASFVRVPNGHTWRRDEALPSPPVRITRPHLSRSIPVNIFTFFFFSPSVSMYWSTKGQKIRDIVNFCIVSSQRHLFSSSIWPFGQKWKREKKKKNQTCWHSHLWTVSNYCPPVLWFRSVTAFPACSVSQLFSIHLLRCFNILLKNTLPLYYLTSETASPI